MRNRRALWLAAGIVVALVVLAVVRLFGSLDAIVEAAIERYGSEITGTRVRVDSVEIAVSSGRGTLRGVTVENPSGFSSEPAFRLGEITLRIDPTTIASSPIVVEEVLIAAPEVLYELNETARSNIQVILENVERYGSGSGDPATPDAGGADESAPDEEATRLSVQSFTFRDGRVRADMRSVGGEELEAELPPVVLKRLGGREGAPPEEIGMRVIRAYGGVVVQRVASSQIQRGIERALEEKSPEIGEALRGLLRRPPE
jgi:hypothetical protein